LAQIQVIAGMEDIMSRKLIAKAVAAAALIVGTTHIASADTWVFKDVSRPQGHERSRAAKKVDADKCGAIGWRLPDEFKPRMQQCMLAHGWALDHIVPDPAPRHARAFRNPFGSSGSDDDLTKRNEDASNNAEQQRDEEARSNEFQQQMQDQQNTDAAIRAQNNE
jgi:hypothetical protein